jgi:hypothetical protein
MKLTLDRFLGYLAGAGCIYFFMLFIDSATGTPFSLPYFFLYWDIIFALIIIIHWLLN